MAPVGPIVEGKQKMLVASYTVSGPAYGKRAREVAERAYEDLVLKQ